MKFITNDFWLGNLQLPNFPDSVFSLLLNIPSIDQNVRLLETFLKVLNFLLLIIKLDSSS